MLSSFGFSNSKKSRKKNVVGITSRTPESCFQWLVNFVMERWRDQLEMRYLPITNRNQRDWEEEVKMCSAVILYHTKYQGRLNVTDVDGALYDNELKYFHDILRRENVVVLLDDMSDTSEEERKRILKTQPSLERLSSRLILIPEHNKTEAADRQLKELFPAIAGGTSTPQWKEESPRTPFPSSSLSSRQPTHSGDTKSGRSHTIDATSSKSNAARKLNSTYQIGIFSRSAESNYTWLVNSLRSDLRAADIKAICITNNYGMFASELQKCRFAILYHTRNMGRLNITNVADSLYDKELRDMSEVLGKENVIVVVDDLRSAEPEDRRRIAMNQPDICKHAKDFLLFTEGKKNEKNLETIRDMIQRSLSKHNIHQPPKYKDSIRKHKESAVGLKSTITQLLSWNSSPSPSESLDFNAAPQKSYITESQSNESRQLSSSEDTNLMEESGMISEDPFLQVSDAMKVLWNASQQENQKLRETTLSQEKTIKELATENDTNRKMIEELTKRMKDMEETARERERKLQNMEKREKELWHREERLIGRESTLLEREKLLLKGERNINEHKKQIEEREKTVQLQEGKVKGIKMKTLSPKREEWAKDGETLHEDQEQFPGGHLEENLQAASGSSWSENETLSERITELQEMNETLSERITELQEMNANKDRKIQKQQEDILSYQHIFESMHHKE